MKVCIVSSYFKQYAAGTEYQTYLYALELKKQGYDVSFMSVTMTGRDGVEECDGFRIYHISMKPFSLVPYLRGGDTYYWKPWRMFKYLEQEKPDIVIQLGAWATTGWLSKFRDRLHYKFIWIASMDPNVARPHFSMKRPLSYWGEKFRNWGIRHADIHWLQNNDQIRAFQEIYPGVSYGSFPNIQPEASEDVTKPADKFEIIWVANLKPVKRPERFVELAEHFKNDPFYHFTMIGKPVSLYDALYERMKELPNFEFLGLQPQDEVNRRIASAHILVNTSVSEGFSNTFVQAWLRHTPVFTLNVDPGQLFEREPVGVSAKDDFAKLCGNIRAISRDRKRLEGMAEAGYTYAMKNHGIAENFPKMIDTIHQLLEKKS